MITFPDVQAKIAAHLRAQSALSGWTVAVRPPTTLPEKLITVRLAGGSRESLVIDSPRITITGWGQNTTDDVGAWQVTETCREIMLAIRNETVQGVVIYRVAENAGPVPSVDPDTGRPRYFFTHELRLRGTVAA